jgi:hypothetical protein
MLCKLNFFLLKAGPRGCNAKYVFGILPWYKNASLSAQSLSVFVLGIIRVQIADTFDIFVYYVPLKIRFCIMHTTMHSNTVEHTLIRMYVGPSDGVPGVGITQLG